MNKNILAGVVLVTLAASASAQGSLAFSSATGTKPRITVGNVNALPTDNIKVELLVAGATALTYSDGAAVAPFLLTLGGGNAGLFSKGVVTAAGIAPGATANVTIRAWDADAGANYADDKTGSSVTFAYKFGGDGTPPSTPGSIVGANLFNGLNVGVPEPSTYALAALGLGGLLFLRRK